MSKLPNLLAHILAVGSASLPLVTPFEILRGTYDNLNMEAKSFLILNGLIVVMLVLRLLKVRQGKPTPLEMQKGGKISTPKGFTDVHSTFSSPSFTSSSSFSAKDFTAINLNCIFDFQGQTYDAYEVLGVPAGSSFEACRRAYIDLKRHSRHSDLIEAAWSVLQYRRS